mmetsp:Transcript_22445/g.85090  ORF Transcript_22445/g.85090 Transcript_22445/m.85090 type:complete len:348 (+) Transcript_22445:57-1100(+)
MADVCLAGWEAKCCRWLSCRGPVPGRRAPEERRSTPSRKPISPASARAATERPWCTSTAVRGRWTVLPWDADAAERSNDCQRTRLNSASSGWAAAMPAHRRSKRGWRTMPSRGSPRPRDARKSRMTASAGRRPAVTEGCRSALNMPASSRAGMAPSPRQRPSRAEKAEAARRCRAWDRTPTTASSNATPGADGRLPGTGRSALESGAKHSEAQRSSSVLMGAPAPRSAARKSASSTPPSPCGSRAARSRRAAPSLATANSPPCLSSVARRAAAASLEDMLLRPPYTVPGPWLPGDAGTMSTPSRCWEDPRPAERPASLSSEPSSPHTPHMTILNALSSGVAPLTSHQ